MILLFIFFAVMGVLVLQSLEHRDGAGVTSFIRNELGGLAEELGLLSRRSIRSR